MGGLGLGGWFGAEPDKGDGEQNCGTYVKPAHYTSINTDNSARRRPKMRTLNLNSVHSGILII